MPLHIANPSTFGTYQPVGAGYGARYAAPAPGVRVGVNAGGYSRAVMSTPAKPNG
jgi:hypothetical protein